MRTITMADLKWALLDVIEQPPELDADAVRDALKAATVCTPEQCKLALLDALREAGKEVAA
jgi:hypothetical protein